MPSLRTNITDHSESVSTLQNIRDKNLTHRHHHNAALNHIPVVTLRVLHIDRPATKLVTIPKYVEKEKSLHNTLPINYRSTSIPCPTSATLLQQIQYLPFMAQSLSRYLLHDSVADIILFQQPVQKSCVALMNMLIISYPPESSPVNGAKMYPIGRLPVKFKMMIFISTRIFKVL